MLNDDGEIEGETPSESRAAAAAAEAAAAAALLVLGPVEPSVDVSGVGEGDSAKVGRLVRPLTTRQRPYALRNASMSPDQVG